MKVKICGLTQAGDAVEAAQAGADAVGFIFYRPSPRFIDPGSAGEIIRRLPPFVTPVGVFVNAGRKEITEAVRVSGVRCIQLHGEEAPDDVEGYPLPVCKSFSVRKGFDPAILSTYRASAYLLDTHVDGAYGGTGRTFDWSLAVEAKKYGPIILSGGINPGNVAEAISVVRPYAIDVSSGVERAPGIKDPERIRKLFAAICDVTFRERPC